MIAADAEVIGQSAFSGSRLSNFQCGAKLREIGTKAFCFCGSLRTFIIPSSVEIVGDGCFEDCFELEKIVFEANSKLKRIGENAFSHCRISSITIPASAQKIDGSAFVYCPMIEIRVAPGSQSFTIRQNLLLTSSGTEIVRYFGTEREVVIPENVEILGKSCFEGSNTLESLILEKYAKLKTIGPSALSRCQLLIGVVIPQSVETIDDFAFRECDELEYCRIDENSVLMRIGREAFSSCHALRSFDVPMGVYGIGQNCFERCAPLFQLRFRSGESLERVMGDRTLDDALEGFGFRKSSSLSKIQVGDGGHIVDEESHLTFVRRE
jgi:hypothetical protein